MASRETLRIVFSLDATIVGHLKAQGLQFEFMKPKEGELGLGPKVLGVMAELGIPTTFSDSAGRAASPVSSDAWRRPLSAGGLKLHCAELPAMRQIVLTVEELEPGSSRSWDAWVSPFLGDTRFVQAWITDAEYDFWQNASQILEYEAVGKPFRHLPLISNGLPPPLQGQNIDTSSNPGRTIIRQGYIEAVGSKMWLGQLFWAAVQRDFETVGDVVGVSIGRQSDLGIVVLVSDRDLTDPGSSETQIRMRQQLYGT